MNRLIPALGLALAALAGTHLGAGFGDPVRVETLRKAMLDVYGER